MPIITPKEVRNTFTSLKFQVYWESSCPSITATDASDAINRSPANTEIDRH
ncbi:MAG: hypothetical protein U5N58_05955 [Actinomycetota bacterium]|nr:hypothetical protein [Actinomycetota bacterium]